MEEKFIPTNQIQYHYLEHAGGNPPLVFMPGLTANAHSFDGLALAGLVPRYRLVALDLRGRGLSDKPETGYSMADHAADVLGLLDRLGLEQVVLGGHSFGGLLTMYIAANFPERVSKLIIIDAAASLHPNLLELIKPSLSRLNRVMPSWDAYLQEMKAMPFFTGWWDTTIESFYRADVKINDDGTVQARSKPEAMMAAIKGALAEPWTDYLANIQQPAILLNATAPYGPPGAPPLLLPDDAQKTVAALKNGRYVQVPGNHMTMLFGEGAKQTVAEIVQFVG